MGKVNGIITNVQTYSLHDGPGIRTLVFLKGCTLRCEWCCNPECQSPDIEVQFHKAKCIRCGTCLQVCERKAINPDLEVKSGFKIDRELCNNCGDCVKACPQQALDFAGEKVSSDELLERVKEDRYFYLTSKGGLTISGGEPLYQFEFTRELLRKSYEHNIDTALETCGCAPWKHFEEVLPYLNLVLYDIKHMDPAKHKQATGASNRLIMSNLKKLAKSGVPIVIRLPLIPKFNLDKNNIIQLATFISSLQNVREVNLMPFHQLGKDKYYNLSKGYALTNLKALESDTEGMHRVMAIKSTLESFGLKTLIG